MTRKRPSKLEQQIPESGFPSGVASPSNVLLVALVALAALCAFLVRTNDSGAVPGAFVQSQERLVEGLARSVAANAGQGVQDLRTAAAVQDIDTDALLKSHGQWRGIALVDGKTKQTISAHGEPVPFDSLPQNASVTPVPGGELRLVVAVRVPGDSGRVLLGTTAPSMPFAPLAGDLQQSLVLIDRNGAVVGSRGAQLQDVKLQHGDQAASSVNPADGKTATVVAQAPVASDSLEGGLGLSIATVSKVPLTAPVSRWPGLVPAAALLAIAVLSYLLVRRMLVRPIKRLRQDALAIAGGNLSHRLRLSRSAEAFRIARTVRECQAALLKRTPPKPIKKVRMSAMVAVVLAALSVLGWSVAVALTSGRGDVLVPNSVVAGSHSQLGGTADAVRRSINDGLADVRAFARINGAQDTKAMQNAVEQLSQQGRYRNVSVVDKDGRSLLSSGRDALRDAGARPEGEGIRLQDVTSSVPVLFAHAPLGDGSRFVVAEYDVEHLAGLLRRAPGEVRLVDADLRVVVSTNAFTAFEPLRADALRVSAGDALGGKPSTDVRTVSGSRSVIAARALDKDGNDLNWAVISEQPASELDLAGNAEQRGALLVSLVGAILAITLFGWNYLVLVKPMRRLAAAADELREGETKETIYPQRQDQIGTIACCLEICRQALLDGPGRLGSVRRPRGAATDVTELIQAVEV